MAIYKLVLQCKGHDISDKEQDYFQMLCEDHMRHLLDIASAHHMELLSAYLMKTTDSAPADLERENE